MQNIGAFSFVAEGCASQPKDAHRCALEENVSAPKHVVRHGRGCAVPISSAQASAADAALALRLNSPGCARNLLHHVLFVPHRPRAPRAGGHQV